MPSEFVTRQQVVDELQPTADLIAAALNKHNELLTEIVAKIGALKLVLAAGMAALESAGTLNRDDVRNVATPATADLDEAIGRKISQILSSDTPPLMTFH